MAAPIYADRVKETSTTTGTGTYTLAGAVTGYQSFAIVGNGNTCYYCATDGSGWEVGLGTYTSSGTTLARTSILKSSNSNAAVSWAAGAKNVFLVFPADKVAPPGSDTCIVFNDAGVWGADASLSYNKTTYNFIMSSTGAAAVHIVAAPAGQAAQHWLNTGTGGSSNRWKWAKNAVAETGSNAGSNFALGAYDDSGAQIGSDVIQIIRAAGGHMSITRPVDITGNFTNQGTAFVYQTANDYFSIDTANFQNIISAAATTQDRHFGTAFNSLFDFTFGAGPYIAGQPGLWYVNSYTIAGAYRDTPFYIDNQTSHVNIGGSLSGGIGVNGSITALAATGMTAVVGIRSDAGTGKIVQFSLSDGRARWNLYADPTAETGSDAGTNFGLTAYKDDGSTVIDTPITIGRALGTPMVVSRPLRGGGQWGRNFMMMGG